MQQSSLATLTIQTDAWTQMRCWICGDEANSGEHMIKASDLKLLFRNVSQKSPLKFHTSLKRNLPIGSIKSDRLKYRALLCARCNNERTHPHDNAWKTLSAYLHKRQPPIRPDTLIRLNRVFGKNSLGAMLDVHLYFLKLFGCLITKYSIPIDIRPFATAILNGVPHPNVWISFGTGLQHPDIKYVGCSNVLIEIISGQVKTASWFYVLDKISVQVIYAEPGEHRKGLVHAWHPSSMGKRIHIVAH